MSEMHENVASEVVLLSPVGRKPDGLAITAFFSESVGYGSVEETCDRDGGKCTVTSFDDYVPGWVRIDRERVNAQTPEETEHIIRNGIALVRKLREA
ncbi:MAG: hypothetical protein JWO35_579 [Candidatus Saccharibacteria bacterium]|nr:hypothetical protein [Candidatus Saccharibacteria bacterium]